MQHLAPQPSTSEHSPIIARPGQETNQKLTDHLFGVSAFAESLGKKFNLPKTAALIGLLHDYGKYHPTFQRYIYQFAVGNSLQFDDNDDQRSTTKLKKGPDHSTAGGLWLLEKINALTSKPKNEPKKQTLFLIADIVAICILSHHSGLIDVVKYSATPLGSRLNDKSKKALFEECKQQAEQEFKDKANPTFKAALSELGQWLHRFDHTFEPASKSSTGQQVKRNYELGALTKMLFSSLIEADRQNSAEFESTDLRQRREQNQHTPDWASAIHYFEQQLQAKVASAEANLGANFSSNSNSNSSTKAHAVFAARQTVSEACKQRAKDPQGIYTLTVPTGGGKTLASLRFALHHAEQHQLDKIFYIIPYTSIIEQNAEVIRNMLPDNAEQPWVMELHSNLDPEQSEQMLVLNNERWHRPIVLITMVRFLDIMFSGGTRSIRRMHEFANSVVIFDEIQTLPVKCTSLMIHQLNFLAQYCRLSAVLCTATQPALRDVLKAFMKKDANIAEMAEIIGQLQLGKPQDEQSTESNAEIVPDVDTLFHDLRRVTIHNQTQGGQTFSTEQLADFVIDKQAQHQSCLVIVNTKRMASSLFQQLRQTQPEQQLFHLSTAMCAVQRELILNEVNQRLSECLPTILVSTQLIEAGVDISLGCVVRSAAGLDSIAQAAGRCNRHGEQEIAPVYVVQLADEKLSKLPDIQTGQKVTLSMFDQQPREQSSFDPLNPQSQQDFFQRYYSAQTADNREQLLYPLKDGSESSLVNLLSRNRNFSNELKGNNYQGREPEWMLRQSFMTAGKAFQAIDAPTRPIIVSLLQADPKNDSPQTGRDLVSELGACQLPQDYQRWNQLMKHAQRFTINVFDHEFKQLCDADAVFRVHSQEEIFALNDTYIDEKLGWTTEVMSCGEFF